MKMPDGRALRTGHAIRKLFCPWAHNLTLLRMPSSSQDILIPCPRTRAWTMHAFKMGSGHIGRRERAR